MRNIIYIKVVLLLLVAVCAVSCEDSTEQFDVPPIKAGMVPLEVKLPGVYTTVGSRAADNSSLQKDGIIHNLPDGSTLRLIVLNNKPANAYITEKDLADQFTYIVQTANGQPYLYRCEVDRNGNMIPGSIDRTPYYLEVGKTFYCMAVSPAKPLSLVKDTVDGQEKYMIAMYNQEELLATNNHWNQTLYSVVDVPTDVSKRATVELNPLMHTMARIRVTIKNGTNITELDGSKPAIELDRVPSDPGTKWQPDNLNSSDSITMPPYNYAVGDSIVAQLGNNILYHRVYIDDCKYLLSWSNIGTNDEPIWNKSIELSAETTILPMDARSTPMIIRLMLYVNHTPMQFHFQTRKCFRPGHTYNYIATVNLSENAIYVVSWQDASWTTELTPLP